MSRYRFCVASAVLAALAVAAPAGAAAAAEQPDPFALYGPRIVFDVERNGAVIGRHEVAFAREGENLVAEARSDMRVTVLGLPVFRFTYTSRDVWRDGLLVSLTAATDDDGKRTAVVATRAGSALLVDGPQGRVEATGPVYPTNHWNPAVQGVSRVLNTITGALNEVTMTAAGREMVQTRRGPVEATLWTYRGQLTADVWYDDAGRWVGMRFPARDGSTIAYVCRQCGVADAAGRVARDGGS